MEITADPDFFDCLRMLWHSQRNYVLSLVDELHEADSLDGLRNIEACPGSNDFYLYNKLYDVYFEYNSDDNTVNLLKMKFHPVADAPTDAPPLRQ